VKSSVNDVPQFLGFAVVAEIVVEALAGAAVPVLSESPFKGPKPAIFSNFTAICSDFEIIV